MACGRTRARAAWCAALIWGSVASPATAQPDSAPEREPVFRTETGGPILTVAARVATGVQPKSVALSPDGRRAVVCNFGRPDRDNVFVYDSETLEQTGAVHFEGNAVESTFTRDGRTLFVSNFRRHVVEVIDFASLEVTAEIPVGINPKTLVLSRDERTLYVANYMGHSVSVVDLAERREVRRLQTGERPRGIAVLEDDTLAVASFRGDLLHFFDPGATRERAHWDMCRYPRDVLVAPDHRSLYVTCSLGHIGFYRLDGEGRHFAVAPTGRNPRSIGLSADGRWLGVANFSSSDVTLIDTVARTHRRIPVPRASRIVGLAMHPGPQIAMYATSWDTAELIVLRGEPPAD